MSFVKLKQEIKNCKSSVFSSQQLTMLIESLKRTRTIPARLKSEEFIAWIDEKKLLTKIILKAENTILERFVKEKVSDFEVALSVASQSYLSHYSALLIHNLTTLKLQDIYISQEQSKKINQFQLQPLQQETVDNVFSRPQRLSNLVYSWQGSKIHFLKGKFSNRLGVKKIKWSNTGLIVTDIERTLLDIAVRPAYAGGVQNVLVAYKNAKDLLSVQKLFHYLMKLKFTYPYHQVIGFYLQEAGYNPNEIAPFAKLPRKINFYLAHGTVEKYYDEEWNIYIPRIF